MKFTNLIVGASFLVGSFVATPAFADSIDDPIIGGAKDFILYNSDGVNTFEDASANLADILTGNASDPTGNVELFASSESVGFSGQATTLSGTLNGASILLSSPDEGDWLIGDFSQQWFSNFLDASLNSLGQAQRALNGESALYSMFVDKGGREAFSDPNISYVNQAGDGTVSIGLAGHLNAYNRTIEQIPDLAPLLKSNFQASEIVKVVYDNGPAQYLYGFSATDSGLTELSDGVSHSGNYEVSFIGNAPGVTGLSIAAFNTSADAVPSQQKTPQSVPEPTTAAALLLVGLTGAAMGKRSLSDS